MVLVQGLSRGGSLGASWGRSHLKARLRVSWGCSIHFQDGSLRRMVPPWRVLAKGHSSRPCGLLYRTAWVSSGYGSAWSKREQGRSHNGLRVLASDSHDVISTTSHSLLRSVWEGTAHGHGRQERRVLGSCLGGWLQQECLTYLYVSPHCLVLNSVST